MYTDVRANGRQLTVIVFIFFIRVFQLHGGTFILELVQLSVVRLVPTGVRSFCYAAMNRGIYVVGGWLLNRPLAETAAGSDVSLS